MPQINGQEVGPIGYGMMGLSWRPNPCPTEQAIATLRASLANGANFWNGGEIYGKPDYNSMTILNKYFEQYPEDADKVVLSIKGAVGDPAGGFRHNLTNNPAEVRRSLDNVLKQLGGRKKLDVFECARRDPNTPLEEVFGVMKEYIDKGLLGGIALSEVSAKTIHEAVKITKIVAVEVELSMWSTDVLTNGVAAACAEHNIPLIAYSPIGRGMLTGQIKSLEDIPEGDMRRHFPRFQPENFEINMQLVRQVGELAAKKGVTPAQLAIAWVRAHSGRPGMPVIIPIPGATTVERVEENSKLVDLTEEEFNEINATLSKFEVKGGRYPDGSPIEG